MGVTAYSKRNGFKNDALIHVYSRKYLLQCIWKVFVENYLDGGYHVPILHKALNKSVDFAERIGDLGLYTYMYPNFMINRYGRWMDINYVYPKNANETFVHFDYFLHGTSENMDCEKNIAVNDTDDLMDGCFYNLHKFEDEDVKFIKESLAASHQVQVEDMLICEAVQRGLQSSAYRSFRGRYAPNLEMALFKFHQLYNQDMFE